jgi:hypothetical protein
MEIVGVMLLSFAFGIIAGWGITTLIEYFIIKIIRRNI